jgi:hypothetical protein
MRLVYFLLRICATAALIVIGPYAVTHPLRYHHLHTAFQVSSHIVSLPCRCLLSKYHCNFVLQFNLKNFVFLSYPRFPLEFILILDSILLTCFLQFAAFSQVLPFH